MTVDTKDKLDKLLERMFRSGDPEHDFFYLGGPMSGYPKFNFPRFNEVAGILRNNGYNIIAPSEMDDPEILLESQQSVTGDHAELSVKYERLLARDVTILAMPACIGGIFLEGWSQSKGANLETAVLHGLSKPVYQFGRGTLGLPVLTRIWAPTDDAKTMLSSPGAVMINDHIKENDYAISD